LCEEIGDRFCIVKVLRVDGNRLLFLSPLEAQRNFETALRLARDLGSLDEEINALNGLAYSYKTQGDLSRAQATLEHALAVCPATGQASCFAAMRMGLSDVLIDKGDLPYAKKTLADALATARLESRNESIGEALNGLGRIATLKGDFASAATLYREAFEIQNKVGNPLSTDDTLIGWGDSLLFQGDAAGARQKYDAVSLDSPQKQFSMARLALRSGEFTRCESLARRAGSGFRDLTRFDDEAMSMVLLGVALVREGKRTQAAEILAPAQAVARKTQRPLARLMVSIGTAQLGGTNSHLSSIFQEARRIGYAPGILDLTAQK
jgi:tetratricopeptide (TPR) repeat protein